MTRTPSRTTRSSKKSISSETSSSDNEDFIKPTLLRTPRKNRSTIKEKQAVTPPKQQRLDTENLSPSTPSQLLNKLILNSPEKFTPKKLFQDQYQSAKRALHSCVPQELPAREKELEVLSGFIGNCIEKKCSGTLYVSGPPGTGKTACLSILLQKEEVLSRCKQLFINCTSIKSAKAIFSKIANDLSLKPNGKTEKDYLDAIETCLKTTRKIILLVLDEIDQLDSKKQSVLYTIFEWPALTNSKLILIGVANALDLTDRILPRLQARCELKPLLMHFAPYSKQQIVDILTERLQGANSLSVFSKPAVQMLAGKVAAVSGDIRRALDIGRRVVEIVEQHSKKNVLKSLENTDNEDVIQTVDLKDVLKVLNSVYGTSQSLNDQEEDTLPLQQKIVLCTLVLILKNARNKDVTVGKLHEVYRKICKKRNLTSVDQAEFVGMCSLIESKGILKISGKKEPRLYKVSLEWDEQEVALALRDKQLMSSIIHDTECLGKL